MSPGGRDATEAPDPGTGHNARLNRALLSLRNSMGDEPPAAAPSAEPSASEKSPAEQLAEETSELDEATADEERRKDDSSAEEAGTSRGED